MFREIHVILSTAFFVFENDYLEVGKGAADTRVKCASVCGFFCPGVRNAGKKDTLRTLF